MPSPPWAAKDPIAKAVIDLARGGEQSLPPQGRDKILTLAYDHGLVPQYASKSPEDGKPIAHRLQARQRVMLATLERVLLSFDRVGIDVTVLKGPFLSELVYPTASDRTFTDLDLLVKPADLDRSIETLTRDEGFLNLPAKRPAADKRELLFGGPAGIAFNVDLHWDLFSYAQLGGSASEATDELWANSTKEETALGPLMTLPMWGYFVFLCTHATLDHRFRLILFRDLAECLDQGVDLRRMIAFAERWQLASPVFVAMLILEGSLGHAVDPDVLRDVRRRSSALRYLEWALPRTDLVRFNGHSVHPVNLAFVLMHDSPRRRLELLAAAPGAFPGWLRRVTKG